MRWSGDEVLRRSGDGSLQRSSLLEDLLLPLRATFWVRLKFSRPRTSSSSIRRNRFARVISSFIVATGYMTNCSRSSMPCCRAYWKDFTAISSEALSIWL